MGFLNAASFRCQAVSTAQGDVNTGVKRNF